MAINSNGIVIRYNIVEEQIQLKASIYLFCSILLLSCSMVSPFLFYPSVIASFAFSAWAFHPSTVLIRWLPFAYSFRLLHRSDDWCWCRCRLWLIFFIDKSQPTTKFSLFFYSPCLVFIVVAIKVHGKSWQLRMSFCVLIFVSLNRKMANETEIVVSKIQCEIPIFEGFPIRFLIP